MKSRSYNPDVGQLVLYNNTQYIHIGLGFYVEEFGDEPKYLLGHKRLLTKENGTPLKVKVPKNLEKSTKK